MNQAQPGVHPAQAMLALDQGGYRTVLEWFERNARREPAGPDEAVLMLEAAVYLDRREDAERLLASTAELSGGLAAAGGDGALARRREALDLELALTSRPGAGLNDRLERLLELAKSTDDIVAEARARDLFARLAVTENDWIGALARAKELIEIGGASRNEFTLGRALVHRGNALRELSRPDEAEIALREAVRHLEATENLRYRAHAQVALAGVTAAAGRTQEALDMLEHAEATLRELGIVREASQARTVAAWAMLAAGRYAEARDKVVTLSESERAGGARELDASALRVLASVAAVSGNALEASRAASDLARKVRADDEIEARLAQARARAIGGEADACADLEALAGEAERAGARRLVSLAMIYHAEALLLHDPIAAEQAVGLARARARTADPWVAAELASLERTRLSQPIRVEGGRVMFDLGGELPYRERAQDVLDRALIRAALARTNGNYAKAGRLIGEKRWNMRFISIQKAGAPKHKTPRRAAAAMKKMKSRPSE